MVNFYLQHLHIICVWLVLGTVTFMFLFGLTSSLQAYNVLDS